MSRLSAVLVAAATACALLGRATADELEPVQRAVEELRYDDARKALDGLLAAGHHRRAELLRLYALRGQVASILDGPEAGEREFRRLLVLDPTQPPPSPKSPVWQRPFEAAQRWVAANGRLIVDAARPTARADAPMAIAVRAASDPLAMVGGARLHYRIFGAGAFRSSARSLSPELPATPAGATIEYWLDVLDATDDVLLRVGAPEQPLRVTVGGESPAEPVASVRNEPLATPPPVEHHRGRTAAIATGAVAVLLLGAGVGLDVAASSEFDGLRSRCARSCGAGDLSTLHTEEHFAAASYALAGAAAVTAVVLLIVDRLAR